MHQAEARRNLQEIIELANNRPKWLVPDATEITIREGQSPTLLQTWTVDPRGVIAVLEDVGATRLDDRRLYLPIVPDRRVGIEGTQASLLTMAGPIEVALFKAEHILSAAHEYQLSDNYLCDELLVEVDAVLLRRCLRFQLRSPVDLREDEGSSSRSLRSVANAVSCLGVPLDTQPTSKVTVQVPSEITAEWAIFDIEVEPPEDMQALSKALDPLSGEEIDSLVASRQLDRVEASIATARGDVTSLKELVEPITTGSVAEAPSSEIAQVRGQLLQRLRRIDDQLAKGLGEIEMLRSESTVAVARVLQVLRSCQEELHTIPRVRIPVPMNDTNTSTLTPVASFKVRKVRIPYTANIGELRQRRLGGPLSLAVMALVLIVIAWRLWYVAPLGPMPTETQRAASFVESRESFITILLVFPALLATQLERRASYQVLTDNSIGVASACAQIGLALPLMIAVFSIGDVRYNLVCGACVVASALLLVLASWSYWFFVRPKTLSKMRRRRVYTEAVG